MSNVIDFDAFRAEREPSDPASQRKFRIGGKEYGMAPVIPAALVLKVLRVKQELGEDAEVTLDVLESLGRSVFGTEAWDTILIEHQIGFDEIVLLLEKIITAYAPKVMGTEVPISGTSRSSTTSSSRGRGSRRTSSGSTGSTS